jgi:hypothetical protein
LTALHVGQTAGHIGDVGIVLLTRNISMSFAVRGSSSSASDLLLSLPECHAATTKLRNNQRLAQPATVRCLTAAVGRLPRFPYSCSPSACDSQWALALALALAAAAAAAAAAPYAYFAALRAAGADLQLSIGCTNDCKQSRCGTAGYCCQQHAATDSSSSALTAAALLLSSLLLLATINGQQKQHPDRR